MCLPIAALGLSALGTAMVGLTLASTAVGLYGQRESGQAQMRALGEANQTRADEIAARAGRELHERARAARRERGQMRAAASESGVNLQSGSFLAALQTSAMNQYNDMGLIVQNERGQQRARQADAASRASQIEIPGFLTSALTLGAAGLGAVDRYRTTTRQGTTRSTGG